MTLIHPSPEGHSSGRARSKYPSATNRTVHATPELSGHNGRSTGRGRLGSKHFQGSLFGSPIQWKGRGRSNLGCQSIFVFSALHELALDASLLDGDEHGKTVETVALDNKNNSPEATIIIDPAVGGAGRVKRGHDDGASKRYAA
ncbi:hypothetical protein [Mesorhizobium sp. M0276]|uniref:hypothetical protein n=1 Tax=Mesorhizobium sp. M0276 TaxID=2956928 RepID=UPI0033389FE6